MGDGFVLIIYPHGLGDLILLTPALRALWSKKPHVAILKRFAGTGLLDNCPWIEDVNEVLPDPWNDTDQKGCLRWAQAYAGRHGLGEPVWIWHPPSIHKIIHNTRALGLDPYADHVNVRTEIWITNDQREEADEWIRSNTTEPYGFLHCKTGMPGLSNAAKKKDFPSQWGRRWFERQGMKRVIEVGVSFRKDQFALPVQFEIMRRADMLCLADSVFYHAAGALEKKVDFAFFGRGESVHNRVKPLMRNEENVYWKLPTL